MRSLNYHYLHYFWATAREGGVAAAAEALHVSQPAISAQIRKLERSLGHELFDRSGRSLTLTAEGKIVLDKDPVRAAAPGAPAARRLSGQPRRRTLHPPAHGVHAASLPSTRSPPTGG